MWASGASQAPVKTIHSSAMLACIVSADAGADGNSGDCPVHKVLCLDPQEAAAAVAGEVVDLN